MTRLSRFVLAAALLATGPAFAQDPGPEPGFTSLFNGTDFTGWRLVNPDSFRIEDGAIVANGSAGHAYYDGPFRDHLFSDFELRIDVMTRPNSNGGVYVLTEFQERGFPGKGFEVQVNNSHSDRIRTGSLYHVLDVLDTSPANDNEWFTETIIVQGMTITIKVDDEEVVSWTQPADWAGSVRANGTPEFPERRISTPGTIALQAHDPNSTVFYRNIRIRPLD
jgi:hypothetical protein